MTKYERAPDLPEGFSAQRSQYGVFLERALAVGDYLKQKWAHGEEHRHGSSTIYAAFINVLRALAEGGDLPVDRKGDYITALKSCLGDRGDNAASVQALSKDILMFEVEHAIRGDPIGIARDSGAVCANVLHAACDAGIFIPAETLKKMRLYALDYKFKDFLGYTHRQCRSGEYSEGDRNTIFENLISSVITSRSFEWDHLMRYLLQISDGVRDDAVRVMLNNEKIRTPFFEACAQHATVQGTTIHPVAGREKSRLYGFLQLLFAACEPFRDALIADTVSKETAVQAAQLLFETDLRRSIPERPTAQLDRERALNVFVAVWDPSHQKQQYYSGVENWNCIVDRGESEHYNLYSLDNGGHQFTREFENKFPDRRMGRELAQAIEAYNAKCKARAQALRVELDKLITSNKGELWTRIAVFYNPDTAPL